MFLTPKVSSSFIVSGAKGRKNSNPKCILSELGEPLGLAHWLRGI
jgi:hypothetical protein